MGIRTKIKEARTNKGLTQEQIAETEKEIIKFAFICIAIGAVILALSQFFEGNPIIGFLNGATPWVLLGLSFLFDILHLNKEGTV